MTFDRETAELLQEIIGCFVKRDGRWFETKTSEGDWASANEDLQDYLEQAVELLELLELTD